MIQFRCPGSCRCGRVIAAPDRQAGQLTACPYSGQRVPVPARYLTEAQWLRSANPLEMLRFLPPGVSERKLRLFAVACCRRVWEALAHPQSRYAVWLAERHAEGQATDAELQKAVHTPVQATDKYFQRFASIEDRTRRTYASMLSAMDDAVALPGLPTPPPESCRIMPVV